MPNLGYRRVNPDGSRNVHCPRCREFIGTASAMTGINSALCAVCHAFDEGIDLTQEQVDALRTVKLGTNVVAHNAMYPMTVEDPMVAISSDPEEAKVGRKGHWIKALVVGIRAGLEVLRDTVPESKKVAREKKSKRIFDLPIDE